MRQTTFLDEVRLLMAGAAAGALASHFLDGASGRRRRSLVREKLRSFSRQAEDGVRKGVRDLSHRVQGAAAEMTAGLRDEPAPDDVVAARVRAKLGRVTSHPHAVCTDVRDGRVVLTGLILRDELARVISAIEGTRGVRGIDNQLDVRDDADGITALQGGRRRNGPRFELMQRNWSPGARLAVGVVASTLAGWAGRRRLRALELAGLTAAARAATNLPLKRLFGIGAGREGIEFKKTMHVHAPVDEVFRYFSDFRNFPRFMTHVREVQIDEGGRSRWAVEGPAGMKVEWDARITQSEPNKMIAWRSGPGSMVEHTGRVRFEPEGEGTRISVELSYNPPAGALGHVVASLFGRDPKHEMDDDLLRFKSLMEEGKARGRGERITREQLSPSEKEPLLH